MPALWETRGGTTFGPQGRVQVRKDGQEIASVRLTVSRIRLTGNGIAALPRDVACKLALVMSIGPSWAFRSRGGDPPALRR